MINALGVVAGVIAVGLTCVAYGVYLLFDENEKLFTEREQNRLYIMRLEDNLDPAILSAVKAKLYHETKRLEAESWLENQI